MMAGKTHLRMEYLMPSLPLVIFWEMFMVDSLGSGGTLRKD